MDDVTNFLQVGFGFGKGNCDRDVDGDGYSFGNGISLGVGFGFGYGNGGGIGNGDGFGRGFGSSGGFVDGFSDGDGDGSGLKSINGVELYNIDGVLTGIYCAHGNVAKGFILQRFAVKPCYIVRDGEVFAHGKTLKDAEEALREKVMENMDEDEAIARFVEHF